nr:hypothetical protein OG999_11880 [Streptomyces sp. NBC_00886]
MSGTATAPGTPVEGIPFLGSPATPSSLATLFQPELSRDGSRPHPVVRALARAAVEHAGQVEHQPS